MFLRLTGLRLVSMHPLLLELVSSGRFHLRHTVGIRILSSLNRAPVSFRLIRDSLFTERPCLLSFLHFTRRHCWHSFFMRRRCRPGIIYGLTHGFTIAL